MCSVVLLRTYYIYLISFYYFLIIICMYCHSLSLFSLSFGCLSASCQTRDNICVQILTDWSALMCFTEWIIENVTPSQLTSLFSFFFFSFLQQLLLMWKILSPSLSLSLTSFYSLYFFLWYSSKFFYKYFLFYSYFFFSIIPGDIIKKCDSKKLLSWWISYI